MGELAAALMPSPICAHLALMVAITSGLWDVSGSQPEERGKGGPRCFCPFDAETKAFPQKSPAGVRPQSELSQPPLPPCEGRALQLRAGLQLHPGRASLVTTRDGCILDMVGRALLPKDAIGDPGALGT